MHCKSKAEKDFPLDFWRYQWHPGEISQGYLEFHVNLQGKAVSKKNNLAIYLLSWHRFLHYSFVWPQTKRHLLICSNSFCSKWSLSALRNIAMSVLSFWRWELQWPGVTGFPCPRGSCSVAEILVRVDGENEDKACNNSAQNQYSTSRFPHNAAARNPSLFSGTTLLEG